MNWNVIHWRKKNTVVKRDSVCVCVCVRARVRLLVEMMKNDELLVSSMSQLKEF